MPGCWANSETTQIATPMPGLEITTRARLASPAPRDAGKWFSLVTPAISDSSTPSTRGPFVHCDCRPVLAPTTTNSEHAIRRTPWPYVKLPIDGSVSYTPALKMAVFATKRSHGRGGQISLLDKLGTRGVSTDSSAFRSSPEPKQYLAHPRDGSRMMTRVRRMRGHAVNRKRIQRLMQLIIVTEYLCSTIGCDVVMVRAWSRHCRVSSAVSCHAQVAFPPSPR